MRRIRANAIAILTVAWILGTFYYLWQDNKPHPATSSRSPGRSRAAVRQEGHREDRTSPGAVSISTLSYIPIKGEGDWSLNKDSLTDEL